MLYVTGYAHFFNEKEDWCNNESFRAVPFGKSPKLSRELRAAINHLTESLNSVCRATVGNCPTKNVRFVDISPGFNTHFFCEADSNHQAQYYDDNVCFWNLSPTVPSPTNTDQQANLPTTSDQQTGLSANAGPDSMFDFGAVSTQSDGSSRLGWKSRQFHPK